MLDWFSFSPTHIALGNPFSPEALNIIPNASFLLWSETYIHVYLTFWSYIRHHKATCPHMSSWSSLLHHPLLHLLLLHLWQLHSSHCSGSKSWWHLWLSPFSHSPHLICQKILSLILSKYAQNLTTSHHPTVTTLVHTTIISCLSYCISFLIIFPDSVLVSYALFSTQQSKWSCLVSSDAAHPPGEKPKAFHWPREPSMTWLPTFCDLNSCSLLINCSGHTDLLALFELHQAHFCSRPFAVAFFSLPRMFFPQVSIWPVPSLPRRALLKHYFFSTIL